jgi:micrococcal nuclease
MLKKFGSNHSILVYVYLSDGKCLNEKMIADGYSKPYNLIACNQLSYFQKLNSTAKKKKLGLYKIRKSVLKMFTLCLPRSL